MLEVCIILSSTLLAPWRKHDGDCMHALSLTEQVEKNAPLAPVAPLFSAFLLKNQ